MFSEGSFPQKQSEATGICGELIDAIESKKPFDTDWLLMKAKRLARLIGDGDAQRWLDYETTGYPKSFTIDSLGSCRKYIEQGRRLADGRLWEARLSALRESVDHSAANRIAEFMIQAIHNYLCDVHSGILLGDDISRVFRRVRAVVDNYLSRECPEAARNLAAAYGRLPAAGDELRAQAMLSCRRLLSELAGRLYPPSKGERTDRKGIQRPVDESSWKNRILAFFEDLQDASKNRALLRNATISDLARRLDAVNGLESDALHNANSQEVCDLALVHTYLLVAEVAVAQRRSEESGAPSK